MSTFNGWTIVSMPGTPAVPKSIEWGLDDVIGEAKSPFSLQKQVQDWGAAILRASLSYQPMSATDARAWVAFLMACRGVGSVFQFGDPVNKGPANPSATAGSVVGSGQTGFSLVTSSSGMTAGDWFSLGVRLYMVTTVSGG